MNALILISVNLFLSLGYENFKRWPCPLLRFPYKKPSIYLRKGVSNMILSIKLSGSSTTVNYNKRSEHFLVYINYYNSTISEFYFVWTTIFELIRTRGSFTVRSR